MNDLRRRCQFLKGRREKQCRPNFFSFHHRVRRLRKNRETFRVDGTNIAFLSLLFLLSKPLNTKISFESKVRKNDSSTIGNRCRHRFFIVFFFPFCQNHYSEAGLRPSRIGLTSEQLHSSHCYRIHRYPMRVIRSIVRQINVSV
jgi:hypothetical protein